MVVAIEAIVLHLDRPLTYRSITLALQGYDYPKCAKYNLLRPKAKRRLEGYLFIAAYNEIQQFYEQVS